MSEAVLTVEDLVARFAVKRDGLFDTPDCRYRGPAAGGDPR